MCFCGVVADGVTGEVVSRRSWGREGRGLSRCCCGGGRVDNVFIASNRARGDSDACEIEATAGLFMVVSGVGDRGGACGSVLSNGSGARCVTNIPWDKEYRA